MQPPGVSWAVISVFWPPAFASVVRIPLRLNPEQMRQLAEDPEELEDVLEEQVEDTLTSLTITRTLGAIENRLGVALEMDREALAESDWDEAAEQILAAVESHLDKRQESLTGANGQVVRHLTGQQDQGIVVERTRGRCPRCGAGFFPPG